MSREEREMESRIMTLHVASIHPVASPIAVEKLEFCETRLLVAGCGGNDSCEGKEDLEAIGL